MILREPEYLMLLVIIPFLIIYHFRRKESAISYSDISLLKGLPYTLRIRFHNIPFFLRVFVIFLFIIAMARPQVGNKKTQIITRGIDIVLAIDVSSSMLAEDFQLDGRRVSRLDVVKEVVKDFINRRRGDRIGLVVFAGMPYTQCPMTLDYGIISELLDNVKVGMIEDGTAIGDGIACALNRLKDSKAKSKIIILLTDGRNNTGKILPEAAANMAKELGVKIYTIGAGTYGYAPYPAVDMFGNKVYTRIQVDIDEETLQKIAHLTGGKYFRATDTEELERIYKIIDKMEKTKHKDILYMQYTEYFNRFVIVGLLVLCGEILLANTVFRKLP